MTAPPDTPERPAVVRTSVLHRTNPTVKLAVVLVLSGAVLLITDPVTPGALYVLALAALAGTRAMGLRALARTQVTFVPFAMGLLVVNVASRTGGALVHVGPLTLGAVGVSIGASLALRTMLVGTLSVALLTTTHPVALMASLHQHARVPATVTYAVLAAFRVLEDLPLAWLTVRSAQAVRDPRRRREDSARPGRVTRLMVPRGLRALGAAAFTLLVVCVRRSERMAVSMETRGLGDGRRTTFTPVALRTSDLVVAGAILALAASTVAASAAMGWLRGPLTLVTRS